MRSLTGRQAWAVVATHELTAREGELLSRCVDRGIESHRYATVAVVGLTALQLINALPAWADPYMGFGYPLLTWLKRRTA